MIANAAEQMRRKIFDALESPQGKALLAEYQPKPDSYREREKAQVALDYELAKLVGEPVLEKILTFNNNESWVYFVQCYGFAIGNPQDWDAAAKKREMFLSWGGLVKEFCGFEVRSQLQPSTRTPYALTIDGMHPISSAEADTISEDHRVFAACTDHFFLRVKPGLWMHKAGSLPVSTGFQTQPVITNIHRAITDYIEYTHFMAGFRGFWTVPKDRMPLGAATPPVYSDEAVKLITNTLWHVVDVKKSNFPESYEIARKEMTQLGIINHPEVIRTFDTMNMLRRERQKLEQKL